MRFPIDVVMFEPECHRGESVRGDATMFRGLANFQAQSVLELPANAIAKSRTAAGDFLRSEIAQLSNSFPEALTRDRSLRGEAAFSDALQERAGS